MASIKPAVCNPSMNFGQQVVSLAFFHFKSAQNKYTLILANQDESSPQEKFQVYGKIRMLMFNADARHPIPAQWSCWIIPIECCVRWFTHSSNPFPYLSADEINTLELFVYDFRVCRKYVEYILKYWRTCILLCILRQMY